MSNSECSPLQSMDSPVTLNLNADGFRDQHSTPSTSRNPQPPEARTTTIESRMQQICSISTALHMIEDYVHILYPLLPVVHLPSFCADLAQKGPDCDPVFFSLLTSICALVAVLLPRRFLEHRSASEFFPYSTPAELVQRCIDIVIPLRDARYHEAPSPEKCAIAYMLGYAAKVAGIKGRSALFWTESASFLKDAGVEMPHSHKAWNCIESQLWKKLFWMWYIVEA